MLGTTRTPINFDNAYGYEFASGDIMRYGYNDPNADEIVGWTNYTTNC